MLAGGQTVELKNGGFVCRADKEARHVTDVPVVHDGLVVMGINGELVGATWLVVFFPELMSKSENVPELMSEDLSRML